MTKDLFIDSIVDEISEGNELDISPKPDRIEKIIDQAKRYFYQNSMDAHQTEYMVISKALMETPLYKSRGIIKLPSCVRSILSLEETGADWINYNVNPDYKKVNYSYLNAAFTGDSDSMVYAISAGMYFDFVRTNFIVKTVGFSYSGLTNYLNIQSRSQLRGLVAQAAIDIPVEKLFELNQFFRYCVGLCRKSIGRIYSVSELKLLGRSGFNITAIKEDGNDEVKEIRDAIKADNESDVGFIMVDGKYIGE
jgi:hypothetical protein